jgi:Methyltransferase domain
MALYEAAGTVGPGKWIVEIGSHHGRSTVALAKGKSSSVGLLAVDPFHQPPNGQGDAACHAFLDNLRRLGLTTDVQLFRGTSQQAATCRDLLFEVAGEEAFRHDNDEQGRGTIVEPAIGLLFVDGLHDRNSVLTDIDLWEPLVVEGGLVYFHDAFFRVGVTLALLERHLLNSWFRYLGSVGNLAMFRRERDVGNRGSVRGSLRLLGRLGYFGRNVVTTLAVRRNWSTLLKLLPPEEDFEY